MWRLPAPSRGSRSPAPLPPPARCGCLRLLAPSECPAASAIEYSGVPACTAGFFSVTDGPLQICEGKGLCGTRADAHNCEYSALGGTARFAFYVAVDHHCFEAFPSFACKPTLPWWHFHTPKKSHYDGWYPRTRTCKRKVLM